MTILLGIMFLLSLLALVGIILLLRKKRFVLAFLLLVAGGGAWYGYKEYTRTNRDLSSVEPDFSMAASGLVKEFEINDSLANKKYLGKIIEIDGMIREVNKDESGFYTVVLGDTTSLSAVRCSMDTTHKADAATLSVGAHCAIRGACTGFNKDEMGLGSDVILNRSVILTMKR